MMRLLPVLLVWTLTAAPAAADWLVTRDGSRIETRGEWRVQGAVVIFTAANGILSSLRLTGVDLEESLRATDGPESPAEPEVSKVEKVEPVLRLTNQDIPRGQVAGDDEADDEERPVLAAAVTEGPVRVTWWQEKAAADGEGIEITGTVQNPSRQMVTGVALTIRLADITGQTVSGEASLDLTSLAAGATSGFRVTVSGVGQIDGEPRFDIRSRELRIGAGGRPASEGF